MGGVSVSYIAVSVPRGLSTYKDPKSEATGRHREAPLRARYLACSYLDPVGDGRHMPR